MLLFFVCQSFFGFALYIQSLRSHSSHLCCCGWDHRLVERPESLRPILFLQLRSKLRRKPVVYLTTVVKWRRSYSNHGDNVFGCPTNSSYFFNLLLVLKYAKRYFSVNCNRYVVSYLYIVYSKRSTIGVSSRKMFRNNYQVRLF